MSTLATYRSLRGRLCFVLALSVTLFEIYTVGFGVMQPLAQRGTLLLFSAVLVFLLFPFAAWDESETLSPPARAGAIAFDLTLIATAIFTCLYVIIEEDALADRSGIETDLDLLVAALGPLMLLEMVRRSVGLPLFLVAVFVIAYAYLGDIVLIAGAFLVALWLIYYFAGKKAAALVLALAAASLLLPDMRAALDPESFPYSGASHSRMAPYLWLTSEGTFGSIAAIMSQFIFIFILFAAMLEATGAGKILMNLAFAMTGRFRGGPAQSAVVASSMFGMVSGSTMANVVSTGTFTIPLMIRTGFSRLFAGAVESVASCGGQIVPPIMGASVFIMAEIIGVPYVYLMLYALIPAFLYFASLAACIYLESGRLGLGGLPASEVPSGRAEFRIGGFLLIPVFVLLGSIISGETPGLAGYKAVIALLIMVDLVRSLTCLRGSYGDRAAIAVAIAVAVLLAVAYGPFAAPAWATVAVPLPWFGDVALNRVLLAAAGLTMLAVPALRGLPGLLPLWLATATWGLPPELNWIGQLPFIGIGLPVLLALGATWLLVLPVMHATERPEGSESCLKQLRDIIGGFDTGARNALSLVAATYVIGLIVGLLVLSALGVRLSIFVTQVASTSLFAAFVLVMLASLVLGMGLPTVAAYLLLVVVVAPSLADLGAPLIAAHMFVFYYGVLSSITPPVALAAYGASGISGADPMHTGFTACRLAVTAFIVPFLFVYYPELLLLEGTAADVAYRLTICTFGIMLVAMAAIGYAFAPLSPALRVVFAGLALMTFLSSLWINLAGAAGAVALILWLRSRHTPTPQHATESNEDPIS